MLHSELKEYILTGSIDEELKNIYCTQDIEAEKERYLNLLDQAFSEFGDGDYHFISSPGRSEIGGNHTDHQHGHILAASLNIDNLIVVKANNSNIVNYRNGNNNQYCISIDDLSLSESEKHTSEALIRGIASKLSSLGYSIGGFDGICDSKVLIGSGISSSACFEVMIVEVFNSLFNEGKISAVDRAKISQYAENVYFGKPSGLLDQMTISVGDFVAIDFKDIDNPVIENYDFSFSDYGYELLLVDTKGDHSDLSDEYSAITNELKMVSNSLGVDYLADTSLEKLMDNFVSIRNKIDNDRAILRAIHFFLEDDRAIRQKQAVIDKDIDTLLSLMNASGHSSFEYLQNVYPSSRTNSQSLAIGLQQAQLILKDKGACRVHGGGFEGTIQAIVPHELLDEFKERMKTVFGDDCILEVRIRPSGTKCVI